MRKKAKDTICALATGAGQSALALLRVSGDQAFSLVKKSCSFLPKNIESHCIYFGTFVDFKTKKPIDEVLVSYFKEGKSFTGEESIEISCHGGKLIYSQILQSLIDAGGRVAEKGEYTYRAFLNGKMDLVQAEGVLDLIHSQSDSAREQALRVLKGALSKKLKCLEQKLVKLLAHLEASIDFSDQEIEPFSLEEQKALLKSITEEVINSLNGFEQARINKEGFFISILGAPNAGKSSLFNFLVGEPKAIVSDCPGTTRDVLFAKAKIKQQELMLQDMAGFRSSKDLIEKEGISRALEASKTSDFCVFLIESQIPLNQNSFYLLEKMAPKKTILLFSKADKLSILDKKQFLKQVDFFLKKTKQEVFFNSNKKLFVSVKTGEGIALLKELFYEKVNKEAGESFLSSLRQVSCFKQIKKYLDRAKQLLEENSSPEFTAFELQMALSELYKLLGKEYNEEVIRQIFKEFCLGK